jgi:predicted nucleic acid-binding Zn ribbon protein
MPQIPQHKHCKECGLAVVKDEEFCSEECKAKHEVEAKKRKNSMMLYYAALIVSVLVLIFVMFAGR